ncbi:MAG: class I SAM-dependent methyltransferase [Proteobacteria bacterium]|nr:class I SAM-dependent methyltransferase [Pseudomonadota bacterium]
MAEIELLKALPKGKRNVKARETAKTEEHIRISREYGEMYFDGPREYGYGGYRYDGRWQPVAKDIVDHFGLKPGDRVLDVGCAKGFLVKDLLALDIDAYGVDISHYALMHCEREVIGRLHLGSADNLPFPDKSFAAVLSINSIHNLPEERCKIALQEMQRLAPGKGFVQVDSFRTPEQKEVFESWVLTAEFYDYPDGWKSLFNAAGYTGDWYWTIIE